MSPARKAAERLPLLPLRDMVVFPRMVLPLLVGRAASIEAVEQALDSERPLFVCAQRNPETDTPGRSDLHTIGVIANVLQTSRLPDGTLKVVVEGMERARLEGVFPQRGYDEAAVRVFADADIAMDADTEGLMRLLRTQFGDYAKQSQRVAPDVSNILGQVENPGELSDFVAAHLSIKPDERQELLEIDGTEERMQRISAILQREIELYQIENRVRERVREQMDRGQREHFLQEHVRALQQELGQVGEGDEVGEMRAAIEKAKMPKEVREKALREVARYERMPPLSPEGSIAQTYVEWLTEVPWHKRSRDKIDLKKAEEVLDADHYGLEKVKERILEFVAVRKLSKRSRGPVLCLVGPPGVGKTSLGRSVARAMGRKFVRVSLGGVRDEAEIRGHRRTYIGALPGRILQSMRDAGIKNPVFMLDEIDKLSNDYRGDPSSALLEVLDPEQNKNFSDHYLEVDFDLHEVFFITTANNEYDIPEALLDRMEIVRMSGYTPLEKEHIARLFLIPRQLDESGISEKQITITDAALQTIIHRYTQEAGVRELNRQIANLCRKVARRIVSDAKAGEKMLRITDSKAYQLLGPPPYLGLDASKKPEEGVAIGLAWTSTGGDILIIETIIGRGKGEYKFTGQLGEVMQESGQAAYTYLRARAKELHIPSEFWKNADIHIHVPEGGIPKDGPSAGTAMTVSMLSALKHKPPRPHLAMTGEITLRGRILPIGGLKEKLLAAQRTGMQTVLVPKDNEKDLQDVPKEILDTLEIILVSDMDEVITHAFPASVRKPMPKKDLPEPKKSIAKKPSRSTPAKRRPARKSTR